MAHLLSLKPFFDEDKLSSSLDYSQLDQLYDVFKSDFMGEEFAFKDKKLKIAPVNSRIKEYEQYNETFTHIVTRKTSQGRIYDASRANRVHWIKCILQNHESKLIHYYKWEDENGICKEHYWFQKKDFMVVLKPLSSNLMIVTAFCVDKDEQLKFLERLRDYEEGKSNC